MIIPTYPELALFILRVIFGFLTFKHGIGKAGKVAQFAERWKLSYPIAWLVYVGQTFGGLLIMAGLFTQLIALAQFVLNVIITYMLITRNKEPFLAPGKHSWSIGVVYTAMALTLVLGGGGILALDTVVVGVLWP